MTFMPASHFTHLFSLPSLPTGSPFPSGSILVHMPPTHHILSQWLSLAWQEPASNSKTSLPLVCHWRERNKLIISFVLQPQTGPLQASSKHVGVRNLLPQNLWQGFKFEQISTTRADQNHSQAGRDLLRSHLVQPPIQTILCKPSSLCKTSQP